MDVEDGYSNSMEVEEEAQLEAEHQEKMKVVAALSGRAVEWVGRRRRLVEEGMLMTVMVALNASLLLKQ